MLNNKDVWKRFKTWNVLELKNCIFIKIFLNAFFEMTILLGFDLKGCLNLEILPNIIKYLTSLKILNLKYYKKLRILPR